MRLYFNPLVNLHLARRGADVPGRRSSRWPTGATASERRAPVPHPARQWRRNEAADGHPAAACLLLAPAQALEPRRTAEGPGTRGAGPGAVGAAALPCLPEPVDRRFRCAAGQGPAQPHPRAACGRARAMPQIMDFVVERYGEFVLLKPRLSAQTLVLWGTPFAVLVHAAGMLLLRRAWPVRRAGTPAQRGRTPGAEEGPGIAADLPQALPKISPGRKVTVRWRTLSSSSLKLTSDGEDRMTNVLTPPASPGFSASVRRRSHGGDRDHRGCHRGFHPRPSAPNQPAGHRSHQGLRRSRRPVMPAVISVEVKFANVAAVG